VQGGRVVIVSDDERWSRVCAAVLEAEHFDVDVVPGELFDAATFATDQPRMVVLDAELQTRSGRGLGMGLRSRFGVPLVMVTDSSNEQHILTCYEAGADVVVERTVGASEFLARVRAMLRRAADRRAVDVETIEAGEVIVRAGERGAWVAGTWVHLTPFELAILRQIMLGLGRTVRRVALLRAVWGPGRDARTLDVHLRSLRAKFEAVEGWRRIETVRGVGFRFVVDQPANTNGALIAGVMPAGHGLAVAGPGALGCELA
jgi:DNA-binding response OmpR family regulator